MYQVQMTCTCGEKYWPTQKWIHEKCGVVNTAIASNTASNKAPASNNASNRRELGKVAGVDGKELAGAGPEVGGDGPQDLPGLALRRKQRWTREAYNAYQREYMRRKRK
jgi:hypothetical protein